MVKYDYWLSYCTECHAGKRLEDDVSVDSDLDERLKEVITNNKQLNSDELHAINAQLYAWLVKRAEKVS